MRSLIFSLFASVMAIASAVCPSSASAQTSCTNAKIKGEFGFVGTGLVPQSPAGGITSFDPVSEIATTTYDGSSGLSVKLWVQYHGNIGPVATIIGTYKVNSDCTGLAELKDNSGKVISTWAFVVVHGGDEIETMALIVATSTRPMYSMNFSQKRI